MNREEYLLVVMTYVKRQEPSPSWRGRTTCPCHRNCEPKQPLQRSFNSFTPSSTALTVARFIGLVNRNLSEQLEVTQHLACSKYNARQRILRQRYRQTGFFSDPFVEIP